MRFYEDAKSFMSGLQVATAKIKQQNAASVQLLSIGCSNANDCALLSDILQTCRKCLPQLHPFLRVIPHRSIINLFFQGNMDILLGFQEDVHARDDIVYKELFELPICCAISDKHPYAQKELLAEEELYSENIVLCNSYPVSSKALSMQKRLEQHFPLNRVYYCDNPNAQITLVTAGYGFAILPQAFTGTAQIRYVPLKNAEIVSYGFFYKNNSANPLLKKFVSMV